MMYLRFLNVAIYYTLLIFVAIDSPHTVIIAAWIWCTCNHCCTLYRFVLQKSKDESFYVVDLGRVLNRYDKWTSEFPRVQPFYAVKCNPDRAILKTLAALGAGFDCASMVNTYSYIQCHYVRHVKEYIVEWDGDCASAGSGSWENHICSNDQAYFSP